MAFTACIQFAKLAKMHSGKCCIWVIFQYFESWNSAEYTLIVLRFTRKRTVWVPLFLKMYD